MIRFITILFLTLTSGILSAQMPETLLKPEANVNVTFRVDMSDNAISPYGVHIAGSFNSWNPAATQMTQAGTSTVYEVTLNLVAGETVQFKYVNGNAWGFDEMVPGDCGVDNGYNSYNRYLLVPGTDTQLPVICFGLCNNQCNCGTIIKSIGPAPSDYISINAALIDIKAHGICGTLILELKPNYVSTIEATFPIPFASLPNSSSHTLTIRPQAGATGLSITSANTTGTINIDRAHHIIFDGRPGGTGSSQLTVSNTSTTGYAIQFINNATHNTVQYCTVTGRNTLTYSGVVSFSSTNQPEGNSFNTIDYCNIRDGSSTPTNLIYSSGTITNYNTQNVNNTISNCNLFNWFSATQSNAAINIAGGSSDWSITNNSFYQTSTRIFSMTAAADVGAIFVSSNNYGYNFTISNNFFGGTAPQCGGTAMTWYGSGSTGSFTPRIIRFSTAAGPFNNILSNKFANMTLTTSGSSGGYSMIYTQGGNANISNNTIGSQTSTGSITCTYGGINTIFLLLLTFGDGSSTGTNNVTNNNIGGVFLNASSTGVVDFRVIYSQALAGSTMTISNNIIGGTVSNSIQQNSNSILSGILVLNPTVGDIIKNNVVRNLTLNNTGSNGRLKGIDIEASGGNHIITGNQVYNLTTSCANTNINNAASIVGIGMIGSAIGGTNVSDNTIYNLHNSNATAAGWINGMYFSTAVDPQPQTTISNNFIYGIQLASSAGGMTGIFIPNNGNALIYNNMIRLGLTSTGASITTPLKIYGIYKATWVNIGVYHNTVYIGGSGVTGSANTYAYYRDASGFVDTVMNNIFYNARSNSGTGTGKHYGIGSHINTLIVCDNNDIYTDGSGGCYGVCAGTNFSDLPAWRTGTTLDQNSISTNPLFISPLAAVPDLHLATGSPCEGGGKLISNVIKDYDGQARAGLTPVDIGADAGNFGFPLDIGTLALFSPGATGCYSSAEEVIMTIRNYGSSVIDFSLNNVTLNASVTGPNPMAFAPVIINSGTLDPNSTQNVTVSLSYDMSAIGTYIFSSSAVVSGDGNPGNDAMNQASRKVTPPMVGIYQIGTAGNYPTLTDAVAAYNNCNCISGPITFSLTDATYPYETYPITINGNGCASPVNTLTIKPAPGINALLSGAVSGGPVVRLKTARYVCIDGSNIPGGTTRNLTIKNTSSSNPNVIVFNSFSTTPVSQCALKNCNIINGANSQSTVVACDATILYDWGYFYDLSIENNEVRRGYHAIYIRGGFASNNINIGGNKLNTSGSEAIFHGGVYVQGVDGGNIFNNDIANFETATAEDDIGIWLATNTKNINVFSNTIHSLKYTGTSGFAAWGMKVTTGMANAGINIYNNLIYDITGPGNDYSGSYYVDNPYGILLFTNQTGINIYYNSINLYGNTLNYANAMSAGIFIGTGSFANIRDNIIVNNLGLAGSTGYGAVGIYAQTGNTQFTDIDYNDYFVAPSGYGIKAIGKISTNSPALTIEAWRSATGKDNHSISSNPLYTSNTNLVPQVGSPVIAAGVPISSVPTDYLRATRSLTATTMGAYETVPGLLTWTGATDDDWNKSTNWSPDGVPFTSTSVSIPHVTNNPVIYQPVTNPALCKDMTIQTGGAVVTINPEKALTVSGTLSNLSGITGLIIKSGGSLIEDTPGVEATVESTVTGGEWHLISSPVTNALSGMFLDKYLQEHNEATNLYSDVILTTMPLLPLKGYALFDNSGFTAQYTGILNTGTQSATLTRTAAGPNSGWNLVGNPYASSIDWDAANGWTKLNVNDAVYIHINSATWASYVNGVGTNGGTQHIAPGQGFFVNVGGVGTGTLEMNNNVRSHINTTFFKNSVSNMVRLQVQGNGYKDEAVVRFVPEATAAFDGKFDSWKLFGEVAEAPQIYSLGDEPLAINSIPEGKTVLVGMRVKKSGTLKIIATEVNDLNYVILEDTKTGLFTNLITGSYSFNFETGENELRFLLHFNPLDLNHVNAETVAVFSFQKTIYIDLKDHFNGNVFIYDLSGRLMEEGPVSRGMNKFSMDQSGYFLVKVITCQSSLVRNVWIN